MADVTLFHSLADGFQKKLGDPIAGSLRMGGLASKYAWNRLRQWRAQRQQARQAHPLHLAGKQIRLDVAANRACVWARAAHAATSP